MRNRKSFLLLLGLLWFGLNAYGVNWDECVKNSNGKTVAPGDNVFEEERDRSRVKIPYNKVDYTLSTSMGSRTTFTEEEFEKIGSITLNRGILTAYGEKFKDGSYNSKAKKWKRVKIYERIEFKVNKGSDWFDCSPYTTSGKIEEDERVADGNGDYYHTFTFGSKGIAITDIKGFWKSVKEKSNFDTNGKVDIYFRRAYYTEIIYRVENDNWIRGYFHEDGDYKKLSVYKCNPGVLMFKENDGVVALNGDPTQGYVILEGRKKDLQVFSNVSSAKDESFEVFDVFGTSSEATVIYLKDMKIKDGMVVDNIGMDKIGTIVPLIAGSKFSIIRGMSSLGVSSEEGKTEVTILPKPKLSGPKASNKRYCPPTKKLSANNDLEYQFNPGGDVFATLKGELCDFGNFSDFQSTYGVEYGWRYWSDGDSQRRKIPVQHGDYKVSREDEMLDFDMDNGGPDLHFPLSSLDINETYYFQQYARLKNFDDTEIYSKGYYTVTFSEKFDPDGLKIELDKNMACQGEDLKGFLYKAYYDAEDKRPSDYNLGGFVFAWELDGKRGKSSDIVREKRNYEGMTGTHIFKVSLADGCGNVIEKVDSLSVRAVPVLDAKKVTTTSANLSLTMKKDQIMGEHLVLKGVEGSLYELLVSDDRKKHDYLFGNKKEVTSSSIINGKLTDDTLFIVKREKDVNGCESKPLAVKFAPLKPMSGNRFNLDTVYICPGSKLPALNTEIISDPVMGGGVSFEYAWQYSPDGISWRDMMNTGVDGNEMRFKEKNYNGTWNITMEQGGEMYVRRMVIANDEDGTTLDVDYGNVLTVKAYKTIATNGLKIELDKNMACYGDSVSMGMVVDSELLLQQEKMSSVRGFKKCLTKYGYFDWWNNENLWETDTMDVFTTSLTKELILHASVEYCGNTVRSKVGVKVTPYERLEVSPTVSACKIVGHEVTIKAVAEDCECVVRTDGGYYPTVGDSSVVKLFLSDVRNYGYTIDINNKKTGCSATVVKSISSTEVEEEKLPVGIGPDGNVYDTVVCAWVDLNLASAISDDGYSYYDWTVDGVSVPSATGASCSYKFTEAGKKYKVRRRSHYYKGGEWCYAVDDDAVITTRPRIDSPVLGTSDEAVCYGGETVLTAKVTGGDNHSSYNLRLMPDGIDASTPVKRMEASVFPVSGLTFSTSYYVVASDLACPDNPWYRSESDKVNVLVEQDLSFNMSSEVGIINEEDFKNGKVIIPIVCEGIEIGEVIGHSLNGGKERRTVYNGEFLKVGATEDIFRDKNSFTFSVVRSGRLLGAKCESRQSKTFMLDNGPNETIQLIGYDSDSDSESQGGNNEEGGNEKESSEQVIRTIRSITDKDVDWDVTRKVSCFDEWKGDDLVFQLSARAKGYLYSYKAETTKGEDVKMNKKYLYKNRLVQVERITEDSLVPYNEQILIVNASTSSVHPTDDVTLHVTRHDTALGLKTTQTFLLRVNAVSGKFTMEVDGKYGIFNNGEGEIELRQGDRVRFEAEATSNIIGSDFTYEWTLEEPINRDYYYLYGGRRGLDGLTSELQSTSCYYYNAGRYPVTLKVSDGECTAVVRDTSLFISQTSVRRYNVAMSLAEGPETSIQDSKYTFTRVYPTLVTDKVTVSSSDDEEHTFILFDEQGRQLSNGRYTDNVEVSTGSLATGVYIIIVDDSKRFKIVKE